MNHFDSLLRWEKLPNADGDETETEGGERHRRRLIHDILASAPQR